MALGKAPGPLGGSCGACGYWAPNLPERGTCHRYAPRPELSVGRDGLEAQWPATQAGQGCGEWVAAPVAVPELTVTRLSPSSAVIGSPDLVLHVEGTGFSADSVILFNHGEEVTSYVSASELTTGVKPSLVSAAVTVPVSVVGAAESVDFTFLASGAPTEGGGPLR